MPEQELSFFTRENLDMYLKDLAKEFRKLNGAKTPAEIILIGGAAILARYGFRNLTYDVDAIIVASSAMKDAINRVGDKHGLPQGWLNADFKRTASYSDKLFEVSVFYRTFSNILNIRVVAAEHLLAMKMMSGRQYKNDLSDIVGILWEHQKNGEPISREAIENAVVSLYGADAVIPQISRQLLDTISTDGDYEALYRRVSENERKSKELLMVFQQEYPYVLRTENIDTVIEQMKRKQNTSPQKDSLLAKLNAAKAAVREADGKSAITRAKKELSDQEH